jgi:hypothetical protein
VLRRGANLSRRDDPYTLLTSTGSGAKAGKTRIHLDLMVRELDTATAMIEGIGGRWLEPGLTRHVDGYYWRCMADPEGNEFDIAAASAGLSFPGGRSLGLGGQEPLEEGPVPLQGHPEILR